MSYGAGLTYYICSGNDGFDYYQTSLRPYCSYAAGKKEFTNPGTYG